jgi:Mg/Co/Ni transporter MgtE
MTEESSDTLSLLKADLNQNRLVEAVSSGPFVTIANDISGIVIYLSLSSALLKHISG